MFASQSASRVEFTMNVLSCLHTEQELSSFLPAVRKGIIGCVTSFQMNSCMISLQFFGFFFHILITNWAFNPFCLPFCQSSTFSL